jgi:hypothetical protein
MKAEQLLPNPCHWFGLVPDAVTRQVRSSANLSGHTQDLETYLCWKARIRERLSR